MFAAGKTAAVSGAAPDAQFNYVTMLLHGDGTNGAQNNTFLDSSTNAFSITRNGNTTQGSFSPYGSGWSNYFNGSSTTPLNFPDNNGFTFDADFTIEAWVFLSSTSAFQIVTSKWDVGGQEWILAVDANGVAEFHWAPYSEGGPAIESSSGAVTANQWTHLAAVRSGSTITLYVNGTSVGTRTNGTAGTNRATLVTVGYLQYLGGDRMTGYVSNLRIVKGTAVYTSAFTPSTTPLTAVSGTELLTCQSNRFIDNSSSPKTASVNGVTVQRFNPFGTSTAYSTSVIGGSGYFDGNGDYLNAPNNTAFQIGTGDFTYECWLYPTNLGGSQKIGFVTGSSGGFGFGLWTNTIQYGHTDIANLYSFTASGMINNQWIHFAVSRASGTMHSYVNGVRVDSRSNSTNFSSYDKASIGGYYDGSQGFTGYISDAKFTKGTGVYTGTTLTVPTAPVSAGSCTLLCSMTNGAIFDNAMMNDLETVGNAQISTSVVKYGTGSLAFDGTGDYLKTPATNLNVGFGTGDFTVEFWIYFNSVSGVRKIYDNYNGNNNPNAAITLGNPTSGRMQWYAGQTQVLQTTTTFTTGIWYHVAISRSSGTSRIFVDGTQEASASDTRTYAVGNANIAIGAEISTSLYSVNGYIDDFRITYGYARYTANFTPPTAAFPNIGPT